VCIKFHELLPNSILSIGHPAMKSSLLLERGGALVLPATGFSGAVLFVWPLLVDEDAVAVCLSWCLTASRNKFILSAHTGVWQLGAGAVGAAAVFPSHAAGTVRGPWPSTAQLTRAVVATAASPFPNAHLLLILTSLCPCVVATFHAHTPTQTNIFLHGDCLSAIPLTCLPSAKSGTGDGTDGEGAFRTVFHSC
jgi:hypothetical protein